MLEKSRGTLFLTKVFKGVVTKFLFNVKEYNKEEYHDDSYLICPNHVSNWDTPIIWSLFAHKYNFRLMMMAEFWDSHPGLKNILHKADIQPIDRINKDPKQIDNLITHIEDRKDKLLAIFPDGRHIAPEVAAFLGEDYTKTVKKGAFYVSAKSGKKLVPVFIEPNRIFCEVRVFYGTPIDPKGLDIYEEDGEVCRKSLNIFIEKWQEQISQLYQQAAKMKNVRPYKFKNVYRENDGYDYPDDPNIKYLEMLKNKLPHIQLSNEYLQMLKTKLPQKPIQAS